ncbi:hypothetical protein HYU45_03180 [Candidatus Daviesbacteria bacterium]|nr:hypothetical protein [Candidatus Daviesbacteria bacterium]
MKSEREPKPCNEPKCPEKAKWHLFDVKEQPNNPIADMCDTHKDKYTSERFRAERIWKEPESLLKSMVSEHF